jgi:MFS family permease
VIPMIPVIAGNLGATLALAGFIAGMLLVGELIGDIPSGALIARFGERTAMIGAAALAMVGLFSSVFAPNPLVLGAGIFVTGVATATFALARHAFLTTFVPLRFRARALSTLGGTFRLGFLIGPFLGAGIISLTGSATSAFWIHIGCCVATAAVLLTLRDPDTLFGSRPGRTPARVGDTEVATETQSLFPTLFAQRRVLLTLGTGSALVAVLRASRQVILPLWALDIGLDETTTSIIIGIAAAVDFSLFFTGGVIMDRAGLLWAAIPSLLGLGVGHIMLAFTHDLADREAWFVAIALLLSLANGIGAGILLTLGANLADPRNPAPFLGAWRFTNDTGGAISPLILAVVTALAGLPIAAAVLGVLGLTGALVMRVFVPRYSPRR